MKGRKWKLLYGLLLGVVSCLLYNTLFTLKNANAALVETNAPTSGLLNCDQNTGKPIELYYGWNSYGTWNANCGEYLGPITINNHFNIHRIRIPFSNTNNTYKFKDKDAYATVSFSMTIYNINSVMPTSFVGRNVSIVETSQDYENMIYDLQPQDAAGNVSTIPNALRLLINGGAQGIKANYTLKVRIPKGVEWDGTLDLQSNINFPDLQNTFYILFSPVRWAYIYDINADIGAEAQQNQEDRNNIESQSEQTSGDANNAEQQMRSGTTNLIGAVTSFTNAMRNARTGSCRLPEISAYGMSLGELDLCTYSPPSWIQGLTSTILSLITVGLAWHVFKRIMGIAKGIAGKG